MNKPFLFTAAGLLLLGALVLLAECALAPAKAKANAYTSIHKYNPRTNTLVVYSPKHYPQATLKGRFPSSYSAVVVAKDVISQELTTEQIRSECFGWVGKDEQ